MAWMNLVRTELWETNLYTFWSLFGLVAYLTLLFSSHLKIKINTELILVMHALMHVQGQHKHFPKQLLENCICHRFWNLKQAQMKYGMYFQEATNISVHDV